MLFFTYQAKLIDGTLVHSDGDLAKAVKAICVATGTPRSYRDSWCNDKLYLYASKTREDCCLIGYVERVCRGGAKTGQALIMHYPGGCRFADATNSTANEAEIKCAFCLRGLYQRHMAEAVEAAGR